MNHHHRRLSFLVLLVAIAACSASDTGAPEATGEAKQALVVGGLAPYPCDPVTKENKWDGSKIQLLLADAMASCDDFSGFLSPRRSIDSMSDAALDAVAGRIQAVAGFNNPQAWRNLRSTKFDVWDSPPPFANCDPISGELTTVSFAFTPVKERMKVSLVATEQVKRADVDLRWPAYNYCIAQHLRDQSPGAAGGEALFLSKAEQRELLETIRERTQIAMVSYATLGAVFASPGEVSSDVAAAYAAQASPPLGPDLRLLLLKQWSLEADPNHTGINDDAPELRQEQLTAMGRDFAGSVQLHTVVTQELAELFARSRSSRESSGALEAGLAPEQQTRADELWGFGSWQQRQAALAFGGDPLAIDEGGPWGHPFGEANPHFARSGFPFGWPTRLQNPYVTTPLKEPQVDELLSLARQYDQLRFDLTSSGVYVPCESIVVESSATKLYDAIEVALGNSVCAGGVLPNGTDCAPWTVPAKEQDSLLWTRYRVTRKHAETLTRLVHDALGPKFGIPNSGLLGVVSKCATRYGALSLSGAMTYENGNMSRLHIKADADFLPRGLPDIAPTFTRNADFRIPQVASISLNVNAQDQGFSNVKQGRFGINPESIRRMGSISALTATREAILDSLATLDANQGQPKARLDDYFKHASKIVGVIDAAVGESGVALRPQVVNLGTRKVLQMSPGSRGRPMWNATVTASPGDSFWSEQGDAVLEVFAISNGWVSEFVANFPKTRVFAGTAPQLGPLLLEARSSGQSAVAVNLAGSRRWSASGIRLNGYFYNNDNLEEGHTLVVWRATAAERGALISSGEVGGSFQLIGKGFVLDPHINHGQYVSYGGALGTWFSGQLTPLSHNPVEVSKDGFGLPTEWVPPFSAELLGGSPGESSVQHLLAAAKQSSADATQAVETAMQNLLRQLDMEFEQAQYEAELSAETAKAQAGIAQDAQAMCGAGKTTCDTSVALRKLDPAWFPALDELPKVFDDDGTTELDCKTLTAPQDPELPPGPGIDSICVLPPPTFQGLPGAKTASTKAGRTTDCFIKRRIDDFMAQDYALAGRVVEAIQSEPGVPSFQDYAGGALQSSFVEQWRAITTVNEQFDVIIKSAKAAKSSTALVDQALENANAKVQRACSGCAMASAIEAGFSFGITPSWSSGPLHAQKKECADARDNQKLALAQAIAARDDAMLAVSSATVGLTDKQAAITQGGVGVQNLQGNAELAKKRHELEIELIASIPTQKTSFGLFRRYRSYDLWRAKALLDSARRYALAARRAIEARYVVNLSELTQPEPFVASPASWADQIYEYDLSLPAAVGLTVSASGAASEPTGVYSNKVKDYVSNLEAFMNGFAVERPTAIAHDEIDVVTVPGLQVSSIAELDGTTIQPDINAWTVQCPGAGQQAGPWVTIPTPENGGVLTACFDSAVVPTGCECQGGDVACLVECVCGCPVNDTGCVSNCDITRPVAARLTFNLDPWGRFNEGVLNEPYVKRYNARWDRLAVNFVGTGVRDCAKAKDPLGCYSEGFLRYDLAHLGRVWVTDYSGTWRSLGVPIGRIEGGKGLAAELWLDPLKDGWTTSYVSAVGRTEFVMRPLGGMYEIAFQAGPDVRLDRIERVQLLVGSQSWVQQK